MCDKDQQTKQENIIDTAYYRIGDPYTKRGNKQTKENKIINDGESNE